MRLHLGSFIAGAVVALAVARVIEDGLPRIKICAKGCCGDEEEPGDGGAPEVNEEQKALVGEEAV